MIPPERLAEYIRALREQGVTGAIKIDGFEFTLAPIIERSSSPPPPARSAKAEYDRMMFAATEGIPDEEQS